MARSSVLPATPVRCRPAHRTIALFCGVTLSGPQFCFGSVQMLPPFWELGEPAMASGASNELLPICRQAGSAAGTA